MLSLKVFKTCLLGRGFHTLIKNVSFSSPTDVGSHNPPLLPDQYGLSQSTHLQGSVSRWHSNPSPIDVVLFSNRCGISQSTPLSFEAQHLCWYTVQYPPLRCSMFLVAHHSVSDFDTICNSSSPSLADIVLFGLSLSGFLSRFLKHVC